MKQLTAINSLVRNNLFWFFLLAFFFVAPWMYLVRFLPLPLSQILGGLLAMALAGHFLVRGGVALTQFHLLLSAWVAWCALSTLWSPYPSYSMPRLLGLIKCYVLVLATWQIARDSRSYAVLNQAFLLGMMIAIISTLGQYFQFVASSDNLEDEGRWRYSGSEYDPNTFSVAVAATFALALQAAKDAHSTLMRYLYISFLPLGSLVIILTASRTGLVCALIVATMFLAMKFRRRGEMIVIAGLIAAVAMSTGYVDLPTEATTRLAQTGESLQEGDLSGRLEIWKAGFDLFASNFLGGVGWGAFEPSMWNYFFRFFAAHNTLLSVAAETGILGIILFILTFGSLGVAAWRQRKHLGPAPLISLVAVFVGSLTLSFSTQQMIWSIVALNAGLINSAKSLQKTAPYQHRKLNVPVLR